MCGYCADSTEEGHDDREHIDMVTAQQMLKGEMSDGSPIPGEPKARARNEAALALERGGVRWNPKERAELAKPHPWECDE